MRSPPSSRRRIASSLPGFGASEEARDAYTLPFFTATLREVLERVAPAREVALAGHSLGGLIAANYAALFGSAVRNLTLMDPAGFLRTPRLALRVLGSGPVVGLMSAIKPSRGFVIRTLENAVHDPNSIPPDVKERAVELAANPAIARAFARVYAGAMHEMLHMRELHERLGAWTGPTLLVWGRQDRFIPFRALATTRGVYPRADVLEIDSCGHCPNVEYPKLVAARMRANGA
jgi:monooxygenase